MVLWLWLRLLLLLQLLLLLLSHGSAVRGHDGGVVAAAVALRGLASQPAVGRDGRQDDFVFGVMLLGLLLLGWLLLLVASGVTVWLLLL